ncbi:glycosyltransferase family 2 protein [Burkholderia territorii]|uniref:glycosyltransferase family 2 protein n=1 Tax=Burkholderia territorii TaxID=1503055 RepID=UPI0018C80075|nr:glycosyltransferase family 2 protein [Burkholderia territorii]
MTIKIYPNSMKLAAGSSDEARAENHVAILMRTKDRPVLLARAFASVLNQTHQDWHLYVVNDGGNPADVEALVSSHETAFAGRLTVIHHEHSKGMEAASNAALHRSHGDFVSIHDDDDSWHPEFLATTTRYLNTPGHSAYAAVITHCTVIFERIEDDGVIEEERVDGYHSPEFVDYGLMLQHNQFPPISLLIRRRTVEAIGDFNADLPVLGDWDYNLRILQQGDIAVIPRKLAYYHHRRSHDVSQYGNTVITGVARHELYSTLYRNSLIRHLTQADPGQIGLIHVLSRQSGKVQELLDRNNAYDHDRHADLRNRIDHLDRSLHQLAMAVERVATTARSIDQGMRPARWLWRRMFPLRRIIAKLRGHV